MAVSIQGEGALAFDATIDISNFQDGIKIIENGLQKTAKVAVDAAKAQNDALVAAVAPLNNALQGVDASFASVVEHLSTLGTAGAKILSGQLDSLLKLQSQLKQSLTNAANPELIAQYNAGLAKTNEQIQLIAGTLDKMQADGNGFDEFKGDDPDKVQKAVVAYTRLRQLKNEIAQLSIDGGRGTEEYEKLNQEAIVLQNSIRNTNKELSLSASNVAGITALQEGVRGVVGGFQALAGAVSIFGGDSKEAEEATKNVIGAMGILNGIQEVSTILAKDSALNFYLQGLQQRFAAGAATQQAVATEAATVAQKGLNAAMLANPVAAILAGLVAIYGAYEIYTHTLGKATDAEKERAAAMANTKEVNDKAAEDYGKEIASINALLQAAKSDVLSRQQKSAALADLQSKYPGYLGSLNLENISTAKSNELIGKQIELLKAKAFAQAAETVYSEKIVAQTKAQNDLATLQANASRIQAGPQGDLLYSKLISEAQKKISDAVIDTNVAFDQQTKAANTLAEAHQSDYEKIEIYIKSLDALIEKSNGTVKALLQIEAAGAKVKLQTASTSKPFDQAEFDKAKNTILQLAQFQIDTDKNSYAYRKQLIQETYDIELKQIAGTGGGDQAKLVAYGKYIAQLTELNNEYRQKDLQAQVDAADAAVTMLTAKGKEGTDAYYNARIVAIKAAAEKELDAARANATSTKAIYAKLNLDLIKLDIERQNARLKAQLDGIAAELALSQKGSDQELQLKIAQIKEQAAQELTQLGLTQEGKAKIINESNKKISDLEKSYNEKNIQDEINTRISSNDALLQAVKAGSLQEYQIKQKLVKDKAALEMISVSYSEENEKLRVAKIADIEAKARAEQKRLTEAFYKDQLETQLKQINAISTGKNATLDLTINDKTSSSADIFAAQRQKIQNDIDSLQKQLRLIDLDILTGNGNADDLELKLDTVKRAMDKAKLELKNLDNAAQYKGLNKTADAISALASGFGTMANNARDLNDGLFKIIGTLSSIAGAASVAVNSMKQFQEAGKGDIAGKISGGLGILGAGVTILSTVSNLINAAEERRYQLQESYKNSLVQAEQYEVAINDLYRQRLATQAAINKSKLEGLKAEAAALKANGISAQSDYDKILADIQTQGKIKMTEALMAQYWMNFKGLNEAVSLQGKTYDELAALSSSGQLDDRAQALFQTLKSLHDQLQQIGTDTAKKLDDINQALTGTTSESISDSIIQGFADGKRSAADFADDFQSLMQKSILNSLGEKGLKDKLDVLYEQFAADADSDGVLTESEIGQLQAAYNAIIESSRKQFDQLQQISGINFNSTDSAGNSVSGAIKGMTQQQADLLAGQFGGLRMTAIQSMEIAKSNLNVLNQIANNTSLLITIDATLRKFDVNGIKVK